MIHGWMRMTVAALVLALLSACSGGGNPRGRWTVLVYMVADNNLEPFAVDDLIEMANAGSSDEVRFVVQADRTPGYSADPVDVLGDWTSTRRFVIREGGFEPISDLGEINMGDPNALADFIEWGVTAFPADRYMLIFWDHGSGWPGFGGDDQNAHDLLTVSELDAGIAAGMAAASLEKFEVIGFDACLMATYEVAATLRPYGKYLLASEELEPGTGWDYRSFGVLMQDPGATVAQFGQAVIDGFIAHSNAIGQGGDATLSLTDLGAPFDAVEAAVQTFVSAANEGIAASFEVPSNIARQRLQTVRYGEMPDPYKSVNNVDLGDLFAKVATVEPARFSGAAAQIESALSAAVVYKRNGPLRQGATGLSIYFPPEQVFYDGGYDGLSAAGSWRSFLASYFGAGATGGGGTTPQFTNDAPFVWFEGTDRIFYFQQALVTGTWQGITRTAFTYGVESTHAPGSYYLLGDHPAEYDDLDAWSSWNRDILAMRQGSGCADGVAPCTFGYAYLSVTETPSGGVALTVPFHYYASAVASAQYAVRQIVVDAGGALLEDAYYLESPGGWGELVAVSGSELWPLVVLYDATGAHWVYAVDDGPFDATSLQTLEYGWTRAEAGANAAGVIEVYDFGGNGDVAFGTAVVPQ